MYLSDQELYDIIYDYVADGDSGLIKLLDHELVPEKYRVVPKMLYRGTIIYKPSLEKPEGRDVLSFSTSKRIATTFARDKAFFGKYRNNYQRVVYTYKPRKEDVIVSIGKFIRSNKKMFNRIEYVTYQKEHEYLLSGWRSNAIIGKSTIVWKSPIQHWQ